jgi:TrmH family RNA methyltransferase
METLSSTRHPRLRKFRSLLREARARKEAGLCVAEGPKLAQEALAAGAALCEFLVTPGFLAQPGQAGLLAALRQAGARGSLVPEGLFAKVSDAESPQGIMLSLEQPRLSPGWALGGLMLAAHELQDPGNLGTLLRSARACGVAHAFLSPGCADAFSPKALRAGAGAQFGMQVHSDEALESLVERCQAQSIPGLALVVKGDTGHAELKLGAQGALVLVGSEGRGLPERLSEKCSYRVKISYPGPVESLNAGVAGSVLLFEMIKKPYK